NYQRVLDAPCYPTIADVPHPVDLVIIGVVNRLIPSVLEQCERHKVGGVCIVSSGYSEMGGDEGPRRQAELSAWVARTGIPVIGPNCLGLMNVPTGVIGFDTAFEKLIPGSVGAVLQIGLMAWTVRVPIRARHIGLRIADT